MKRKKAEKLSPIWRRLQQHGRGCTWLRFSDRENRKCSCGLFEAREEVRRLEILAYGELKNA